MNHPLRVKVRGVQRDGVAHDAEPIVPLLVERRHDNLPELLVEGLSILGRAVFGFLALRHEDFITAAELAGAGQMRIILRHMVPSFLSHIIAATSLAFVLSRISTNLCSLYFTLFRVGVPQRCSQSVRPVKGHHFS